MHHNAEKDRIELYAANAFLPKYNAIMNSSYIIQEHRDAPDFKCVDGGCNTLYIEITTTEDAPGDTQRILGRGAQIRPKKSSADAGGLRPVRHADKLRSFANTYQILMQRIDAKLEKEYRTDAALLILDTSPIDWGWEDELSAIRNEVNQLDRQYSGGIWLLSLQGDQLWRLHAGG